jgi:GDPmannose 4,6-dehydratase
MSPRALITGITGQDGSYLAELLLDEGYEVHGLVRADSTGTFPRIAHLLDRLILHEGDLLDERSLGEVLLSSEPDEIYNLAGTSSVAGSWSHPVLAAEFTGVGVARMLEVVRNSRPHSRFYQACSSEMFGLAREVPQNERTPLNPETPYGAAKAYAHFLIASYRDGHDLYACSGILYNHESPRRGLEFVTRKITHGAAAIKLGVKAELRLGDLGARRDWGYAPDHVRAMWLMLQSDHPVDYVIGTGTTHAVRDIIEIAFGHLDLDPEEYVRVDEALMRPAEVKNLVADSSKAKAELGWEPQMGFEQMIREMAESDLELLRSGGDRVRA